MREKGFSIILILFLLVLAALFALSVMLSGRASFEVSKATEKGKALEVAADYALERLISEKTQFEENLPSGILVYSGKYEKSSGIYELDTDINMQSFTEEVSGSGKAVIFAATAETTFRKSIIRRAKEAAVLIKAEE